MVTFPQPGETKISIQRVYENNVVFAANEAGFIPPPPLYPGPIFKMIKRVPNQLDHIIGKLVVTKNGPFISICKYNPPPWDNSYLFTPMKATMANGFAPPPVIEDLAYAESSPTINTVGKISVKSPFYETLQVFMESQNHPQDNAIIRLINPSGKTVLEQKTQTPFEQLSIPVDQISSGIYLLRFETEEDVQTLKVVKGE